MITTCILYGVVITYQLFGSTMSIPAPIAFKTCIECEKRKTIDQVRYTKDKPVKATLICQETEIKK